MRDFRIDDPDPLIRAIAWKGGLSGLGRALDPPVSPQAVFKWVKRGTAPIGQAVAIEKATDGFVTRQQLCPNFYE